MADKPEIEVLIAKTPPGMVVIVDLHCRAGHKSTVRNSSALIGKCPVCGAKVACVNPRLVKEGSK